MSKWPCTPVMPSVNNWIVNLEQNSLEVYRGSDGERYATSLTVRDAEPTTCQDFPNDPIDWA
jgi:hypothetical protein